MNITNTNRHNLLLISIVSNIMIKFSISNMIPINQTIMRTKQPPEGAGATIALMTLIMIISLMILISLITLIALISLISLISLIALRQ